MGTFLKVGKSPVKDRRLYCMRIITPDGVYFKFGIASGHSAKDRMLQIAASYYDVYRETPIIKIMRDRKIDADKVFGYETTLHRFFNYYQFNRSTYRSFDGCTECFLVEIDPALQAFDAVIEGMVPDFEYYNEADTLPF